MKKILYNVIGLLIILQPALKAQELEVAEMQESPFQLTFFVPPLSTNGIYNSRMVNKVSINLLIGNSGGINGFETGVLLNSVNKNVRGFQLSGFGNIVGGSVEGCQLSSFLNINGRHTSVFQGAGFLNVTGKDLNGFQVSGFLNTAGGSSRGAQISGFANLTGRHTAGFQGSGFGNISESLSGAQVAGFCNIVEAIDKGLQASGFINIASSGSANAQITGFLNISGNINGIQASAFGNIAGSVKGVQIAGFINICDSIEGVPVGFINIVKKNGYRAIEFSASEMKYANISYKMGVRRLYNIYSFGKPSGPGSRWMYGFGLGSEFDLSPGMLLNVEAEVNQEIWIADVEAGLFLNADRLNMHNQLRANFGWKIQDQVVLFIGPSFNVSVSDTRSSEGLKSWYAIAPSWTFYNHYSGYENRTNVSIWFGINGGIRF